MFVFDCLEEEPAYEFVIVLFNSYHHVVITIGLQLAKISIALVEEEGDDGFVAALAGEVQTVTLQLIIAKKIWINVQLCDQEIHAVEISVISCQM